MPRVIAWIAHYTDESKFFDKTNHLRQNDFTWDPSHRIWISKELPEAEATALAIKVMTEAKITCKLVSDVNIKEKEDVSTTR